MVIGKIITFDGHDNVGKTSLIKRCSELMIQNGKRTEICKSLNDAFDKHRHDSEYAQNNPWFYLTAWKITEDKIRDASLENDYIFVDRSFYSTQVLCNVLEINFPEFVLDYFLNPDLAIQVKVCEEIRLQRMSLIRNQLSKVDKKTINKDLICKANKYYDTLGLYPFYNNGTLEQGANKLFEIIEKI
jgi:thymidylate kinase